MNGPVAELTPAQQAEFARHLDRVTVAIDRLKAKQAHLMGVAGRAPAGSKRRRNAVELARAVTVCAAALAREPGLAAQLDREGFLDAGWERLGRRVMNHLRKTGAVT